MAKESTISPSVIPYLLYEDGTKALDFLCRAFNFKERTRVPRADGTLMHAEVEHEGHGIMLGTPVDDQGKIKSLRHDAGMDGMEPYSTLCYVSDIKSHFARAKEAGARILLEPQERAQGEEMYAAADPEGHSWYFSTKRG